VSSAEVGDLELILFWQHAASAVDYLRGVVTQEVKGLVEDQMLELDEFL
jgi:hypothetical protein